MANKPDVRVRLSAEGVDEVVKAFKRIEEEARKADKGSRAAADGAKLLKQELGGIIDLLPQLTAAAAVLGFANLVKGSIEAAVNLGKLEQKTGISVKTLSLLHFAAQQSGQDVEAMSKALIKGTRFFDDYDQGATKARDTVKNLFGNENSLQGLNEDQRILKIVDALAKLEPGAKRTGAAIGIFGRAGAEMLPVIDRLGKEGIAGLQREAEKLGVTIDDELVQSARRAHEELLDLEAAAQGAANQFATGFLPAATQVGEGLVTAIEGKGTKSFRVMGEYAGDALKTIIGLFITLGTIIGGVAATLLDVFDYNLGLVKTSASTLFEAFKDAASGDFTKAWAAIKEGGHEVATDSQQQAGRLKAIWSGVADSLKDSYAKLLENPDDGNRVTKPRDKSRSVNQNDEGIKTAIALADARRKLTEANLNAELAILRAHNKLESEAEQEKYKQGLIAVEKYYADRAARINAESDKETALLKAKAAAVQKEIDFEESRGLKKNETPGEREAKVDSLRANLAGLDAEIKIADITRQAALNANASEQLNDTRELSRAQLEANSKLAAEEGRRFEAERLALQAQIAGEKQLAGETPQQFAARKTSLQNAGNQKIDFEQLQEQARVALAGIATARQGIDAEIAKGQIDQLGGEEKLRALEALRLPVLQQIAKAMLDSAVTPEQIQSAQEFSVQVDQIGTASSRAAQYHAGFVASLEEGIHSGALTFLNELGDGTHSVGQAFRDMGLSILNSLRQWAAQMLVNIITMKLMKALLGGGSGGGFSGGGLVSGFGGGSGDGGGVNAAEGGYISGPGSATSDSIPARLSNGEFVMREAIVSRPGMLPFLHMLNGMQSMNVRGRSRFAAGGLVDAAPDGGRPFGGSAALKATLDLDPGLVLKRLEASHEFAQVLVRTSEKNAKRMNTALGR